MIGSGCRHLYRVLVTGALLLPLAVGATPTDRIIIKVSEEMRPAMLADGGPAPRARQRVTALSTATGRELAWLRAMSGGADVLVLPGALPLEEVDAIAASLARVPGVEYAVPDHRVFPVLVPNDPWFDDQWHLQAVRTTSPVNYGVDAPAAWEITTGSNVTVAVLDTGVIFQHQDLDSKLLPGYDMISDVFTANDGDGRDDDPSDPGDWGDGVNCTASNSSWHGTHVAGTIGAVTDNGLGVAGISWGAMILPVRVLGRCGGNSSDVIDGIRWAAGLPVSGVPSNPNPARIINLSLGGRGICSTAWQNAINDATATGALVIAAAGNVSPNGENLNTTAWTPASCQRTLTVAASARDGSRASYSNFGNAVGISAPGGITQTNNAIISTLDSGLTSPQFDSFIGTRLGTSMASAHVAGTAALILSHRPDLDWQEVTYLLTTHATPFPEGSNCATGGGCGTGIVNAGLAVAAATDFEGIPARSGGGGAMGLWGVLLLGYPVAVRVLRRRRPPQTSPASTP